jgi:hypothetical protein
MSEAKPKMKLTKYLDLFDVLLFTAIILFMLSYSKCHAQQVAVGQWNDQTRLSLAQCLVAETGWGNFAEKAAVAHVLIKRWEDRRRVEKHVTLNTVIRRYCSVFKAKTPKPWVRRLPSGELRHDPGMKPYTWTEYIEPWRQVRHFVGMLEAGWVLDPTYEACHFGSVDDHHKRVRTGKLKRVRLLPHQVRDPNTGDEVRLNNYFYACV